jgi:hypothetical protein
MGIRFIDMVVLINRAARSIGKATTICITQEGVKEV